MSNIDLPTERYIINRFVSMPKLFDYLGIDYRVDSNMYCPFHDNRHTPAAHLYSDETGYRLWCFSENKMYGAWNLYKEYLPKIDTNQLALRIFNSMSKEDQDKLMEDIGAEQELETLPFSNSLKDFKQHKINITQLLSTIADCYHNDA